MFHFQYGLKASILNKASIYNYCCNVTVLSFFDVKKQKPKMDLKKCYQYNIGIEISLDRKVCFSLVMWKLIIKLHSIWPIRSLKFWYLGDYYLNWQVNPSHLTLKVLVVDRYLANSKFVLIIAKFWQLHCATDFVLFFRFY